MDPKTVQDMLSRLDLINGLTDSFSCPGISIVQDSTPMGYRTRIAQGFQGAGSTDLQAKTDAEEVLFDPDRSGFAL